MHRAPSVLFHAKSRLLLTRAFPTIVANVLGRKPATRVLSPHSSRELRVEKAAQYTSPTPPRRAVDQCGIPGAGSGTQVLDVMAHDFSVVYVTVPDLDTGDTGDPFLKNNDLVATGKQIGRSLVSEKLAACVNVIPGLTSIYSWQGSVEEDAEKLLMIKTKSALVQEVAAKVEDLHPFDVCEVIAVPITDGSAVYLKWIGESTKESEGSSKETV